jgi:hypothetical protein
MTSKWEDAKARKQALDEASGRDVEAARAKAREATESLQGGIEQAEHGDMRLPQERSST